MRQETDRLQLAEDDHTFSTTTRAQGGKRSPKIDGPIFEDFCLIKFLWTQSISRNTFKGLVKVSPQNAD
jgi:hypothetical protein